MTGHAATGPCPRCGTPVIRTPDGGLLEARPHRLAIHLPAGGRLTWRQAVDIAAGREPPQGHHVHKPGAYGCNPQPQPTLF